MIYYQDDNIEFSFREFEGVAYLHCIVGRWSLSIYKTALAVFGRFLNEMSERDNMRVITITPNPKFAAIFGGRHLRSFEQDCKFYEVYEWDLIQ